MLTGYIKHPELKKFVDITTKKVTIRNLKKLFFKNIRIKSFLNFE